MDSITQAALGAAVGEAVLGRKIGSKGPVLGAVIGTVPDLDVLLVPLFDELEKISLHRGYSHSILFCFAGAFLFAYILSKIKWTNGVSYRKLWLLSFFSLFTHVLLDTFTTYGTQLFLPFSDYRFSFDSIPIIDPFYSIPLLVGTLISVFKYKRLDRRRGLPNILGLTISTLYLLFTLVNKYSVN